MLSGAPWEAARPAVLRAIGLPPEPDAYVEEAAERLDEAYRRAAGGLPRNAAVNVGAEGIHLDVARLDRLEEPASLVELREQTSPQLVLPMGGAGMAC